MRETYRHETARFVIRSFGNGLAYCLTHKAQRREVFLQGDDATTFHDEWNAIGEAKPHWNADGQLGHMFALYCDVAPDCAA